MTTPAGLELEHVEFTYAGQRAPGDFRLAIPAWRVEAGEAVVLAGPSGSGKSTLLDLAAGILVPHRGRVSAGGFEWGAHTDAERRRRRIARVGLVFQEFELLDHLSVFENVLLPYFVNPALVLDQGARERARELIESAGIAHHLDRRPRQLSQGERQRVALCRALVAAPSLLLADEPTGNLDPESAHAAVELLLSEARRRGATLVMVTHDPGLRSRFDRSVQLTDLLERADAPLGARP